MIEFENLGRLNAAFAEDYRKKLDEVLTRGRFILDKEVTEFEKAFAEYCTVPFCAGVANGTDALTIAIQAFSFTPGSEVIVPANTYIASIMAIINSGMKPVLVEPDIRTYTIDQSRITAVITGKTVAIMPVHLYGKCCEMDSVVKIAAKHKLKVIEDCAQAHGASFKGRRVGSFGDFGAFSFYPTKILGALGDGGGLTTRSEELDRKVRSLRNYGSSSKYFNDDAGQNSRLDELQAAFLSVKLKSLDKIISHKQRLAGIYAAGLKEDFVKPLSHSDFTDVFHIYPVRHPRRDKLREYLRRYDIGTEIHYPVPPFRQKVYSELYNPGDYPVSDEIHNTILSLPISLIHTESDIARVVDVMNKF